MRKGGNVLNEADFKKRRKKNVNVKGKAPKTGYIFFQ